MNLRKDANRMLPSDTLLTLFEYTNVRGLVNLCATCKDMHAAYRDLQTRLPRAGRTLLYPRQVDAIKYITDQVDGGEKTVVFNAPMSFGKTLVGIELARKYSTGGTVIVAIPSQIEAVWKDEMAKYYPEMISRAKMDSRRVYFATSKQTAQVKYITGVVAAAPSLLCGKIIVTNQPEIIPPSHVSLMIVDECHLNQGYFTLYRDKYTDVPIVMMGASEIATNATRVKVESHLPLPEVEEEIIHKKASMHRIADVACDSTASHVIISVPSADYADGITAAIGGRKRLHNYTTRAARSLTAFVENGGILLTTIRMIAEGNNFNICSHLILALPNVRMGAEGAISLRRIQQVRGRVCRQSSKYSKVKVTYISEDSVMVARAMLAHTESLGYEIVERANLHSVIESILPMWTILSDGELAGLLACPVLPNHSIKSAPPILSINEFLTILNS